MVGPNCSSVIVLDRFARDANDVHVHMVEDPSPIIWT